MIKHYQAVLMDKNGYILTFQTFQASEKGRQELLTWVDRNTMISNKIEITRWNEKGERE